MSEKMEKMIRRRHSNILLVVWQVAVPKINSFKITKDISDWYQWAYIKKKYEIKYIFREA